MSQVSHLQMNLNELAPTIPLDDTWRFALGDKPETTWNEIHVPGCWEAQGYSKWIEGPARYQREVEIPADWQGRTIVAEFDAVSYAATFFCNGQPAGEHRGLWTPFAVDITSALREPSGRGQINTLELQIWKPSNDLQGGRYPLRTTLAGFLPDVATTFGGVWQSARLRAYTASFAPLRIDADPDSGALRVLSHLTTPPDDQGDYSLHLEVLDGQRVIAAQEVGQAQAGPLDMTIHAPHHRLWSPEQPALYQARLQARQELSGRGQAIAQATARVGFRRLSSDGERLLLNGQPICLRGALSWGWNPERIAPVYTAAQARAEMRRARALGFNLIKLCLFVPNQSYYDVADEEGMLLWQEWPLWLPEVTDELRARAPAEYADYMQLTRCHPSVALYSIGCELGKNVDESLLRQLDAVMRNEAAHVLICDNSGSGEAYSGLAVDFADFTDYHTYGDLQFLEPTLDHWRRDWQRPRPWIFGEFCDSDGFRDLGEIIAANGGQKPWWMTDDIPVAVWRPEVRALLEAEERLAQANLGFTPQELARIANAQSLMVRKYTLEAVRRRAAVQGYVITGLRDTPIATSGIFDDLGRAKWPTEEFRAFNADAILCLDGGRSRVWRHGGDRPERLDVHNWWAGEGLRLHIILNHAGRAWSAATLSTGGRLNWRVRRADGSVLAQKSVEVDRTLPAGGRPVEVGVVELALPALSQAEEWSLEADFAGGAVACANRWPLWVYPRPSTWPATLCIYDPVGMLGEYTGVLAGVPTVSSLHARPEAGVVMTSVLDEEILAYLRSGGRVLLLQQSSRPLPARRGPFWREAIKLLSPHLLWQLFPQAGYVDMQFWGLAADLMFDTARLHEALPEAAQVTPIMRRLDAREFTVTDYLFEARMGKGWLLACALRLQGGLGAQPTGLQRNVAGYYLLAAMAEYIGSRV